MTSSIPEREKIRIEIVSSIEALAPFAESWNLLALQAPQQTPMLSHAYVTTYFEQFLEPGESWFCLLALRGEELLGLFPVVVTPATHAGIDRPLLRAPFNMHIASVDFLCKNGLALIVFPLLFDGFKKTLNKSSGLELLRIPAASPTLSLLDGCLRGATVIKEFNGRGSFIDTSGSFEEYRSGLGHNFSRNLIKAHNKISTLPDVRTSFFSGAKADPKEIYTLMKIEASGWKGKAGTAIISSKATREFYTHLTRRLSEIGWLEWHILYTDNRPIAMHFAIKMGTTLVINKIGFDEEFARYSPGNILFEQTVKRAFDSGDTDEINCLTDMTWHDNWRMIKKDYFDFWIYPLKPIPLVYGLLPKKIRRLGRRMPALKSLYKRIRSLVAGA
jgi:hypothetical protein